MDLLQIFHTQFHQIFNTFDDMSCLSEFVYMGDIGIVNDNSVTNDVETGLNVDTLISAVTTYNIISDIQPNNTCKTTKKYDIFSPKKDDSLFWSIYIAKHGVKEFLGIGQKYHNCELEEKQKIIATFQKNKTPLKQSNIKVSNVMIQEILADLMINKKTQSQTIVAFAVYYNITIYLVNEDKNIFLRFEPESASETTIIYKNTTNGTTNYNYSVDTNVSPDKLVKINDTMIQLEHGGKHFRGISYYKMEDLEKFAVKLGIDITVRKMKKAEIYSLIVDKAVL